MKTAKTTFPIWTWGVYLMLFALSIPWYLPSRIEMNLVLGLPLWLVSSIGAIFLTALFTFWITNRYWKEEE